MALKSHIKRRKNSLRDSIPQKVQGKRGANHCNQHLSRIPSDLTDQGGAILWTFYLYESRERERETNLRIFLSAWDRRKQINVDQQRLFWYVKSLIQEPRHLSHRQPQHQLELLHHKVQAAGIPCYHNSLTKFHISTFLTDLLTAKNNIMLQVLRSLVYILFDFLSSLGYLFFLALTRQY